MHLIGCYLFKVVWYEIQIDIQEDFIENLNLLIRIFHFSKLLQIEKIIALSKTIFNAKLKLHQDLKFFV